MFTAGWIVLSITWLIQAFYGAAKPWITVKMMRRQRKRHIEESRGARRRPVALIVAVKGVSPEFARFLELVTHQDYPGYRLIFVTESAEDPALAAMRQFLGLASQESVWRRQGADAGIQEVRIVVAGQASDCGQKVFNQLAAFRELGSSDEIVAFADADIVGGPEWLNQLVMPLNLDEGDLSTGYRWFFPRRPSLPNALATNINAGIAIMNGPSWHTLLWGGSMALTRECFDELQVPMLLQGCLNDDLAISVAARKARKRFQFVRYLMAATPVDYTWSSMIEFGRRQYFQVRVYTPAFWWTAFLFTSAWCLAMIWNWVALFRGYEGAAAVIGAVIMLDGVRSLLRTGYLRELFSLEQRALLRWTRGLEWWTTWLHMMVHWFLIVSVLPIREITWAGIRYRVLGPRKVSVMSR